MLLTGKKRLKRNSDGKAGKNIMTESNMNSKEINIFIKSLFVHICIVIIAITRSNLSIK